MKLPSEWSRAPVLQIIQNTSEKYCPYLYLLVDPISWPNELKRYIQKCTLSSTFDIRNSEVYGMVRKTKNSKYYKNGTNNFHEIKSSEPEHQITYNL